MAATPMHAANSNAVKERTADLPIDRRSPGTLTSLTAAGRRGSGLAAKLWIRQEEVETNGSLSAGRFFDAYILRTLATKDGPGYRAIFNFVNRRDDGDDA